MARDESSDETDDSTREQGIEFGRLEQALEEHDYPTTRDELIAEYGDYELDTGGGVETFGAVLKRFGDETGDDQSQHFESADGVRQAVFNLIGSDAVGRQKYSDRGGMLKDGDEDEASSDESM